MNIPLVAIIGLPNVGKSTFFNKVLGIRKALTYPEAGTTRDRHFGITTWSKRSFYLIDTAGVARPGSPLERDIQKQTSIALEEADLILLMVDGKTAPSNQDFAVANKLTKAAKPVVLTVNKIDTRNTKTETQAYEYLKLGLGKPFLISSINGTGIGDLLDEIVEKLKRAALNVEVSPSKEGGPLKIAFIGKPNVGKSSLINALLKQERLLVHEKAGTTRSSVDIPFEYKQNEFILIDTAGIKKKWKQDADVETAAAFQSLRVLAQTDVALFVLDASSEITVQDQVIAQQILEADKPAIVVLNKTDLVLEDDKDKLLNKLPDYFPQAWFLPVVFASAKTGLNLEVILDLAINAYNNASKEVDPEALDKFLDKILSDHPPGKMDDQRTPKVYNLKQIGIKPPTFKLTVNFPTAIAGGWRKYFEKQFRLKFGFEGNPVIIQYIKRS